MDLSKAGLLSFDEGYFERIWGGRKLESIYGKPLPARKPIGETWLVSDHPQHTSIVRDGPFEGYSLRELLESAPREVLGTRPKPARRGLFPLLLKLLDSSDYLSIQVHPNDLQAERLGEPDGGKSEMWHVLSSAESSELICGLADGVTEEQFHNAIKNGSAGDLLRHLNVSPGTSVFVPAGTVHAIGKDIVLAEIQQNSDVTYRVYDWGRVQPDGTARELHVEKSLEVSAFGTTHPGAAKPLGRREADAEWSVLAACEFFAADRIALDGVFQRDTRQESFHLLLCVDGELTVTAESAGRLALPGDAAMVLGASGRYSVEGSGAFLDYYVPNIRDDIIDPLTNVGHGPNAIASLGIGAW